MQLSAGEYLCLEGDKGSSLYIVKSGKLVGTQGRNGKEVHFGPGSIIGEFNLLEGGPREFSLRADENSEIIEIEHATLDSTLQQQPEWLRSILEFLSNRAHIAQKNKETNDVIQAFPVFLYQMKVYLQSHETNSVPVEVICQRMKTLNDTRPEDTMRLLKSLQDLELLKVQNNTIHVSSQQIIPLLYETLRYRALTKKVSPNILSMTDQLILSIFKDLAKESSTPQNGGFSTVSTEKLIEAAKKQMHGITLTSRTIAPLVEKQLLSPATPFDIHAPIESISFFYADFDKILDLLELNRIFPLLDKNLV